MKYLKFTQTTPFRIFLIALGIFMLFSWSGDFIAHGYIYVPFIIAFATCAMIASLLLDIKPKQHKGVSDSKCSLTYDPRVCAICPKPCVDTKDKTE